MYRAFLAEIPALFNDANNWLAPNAQANLTPAQIAARVLLTKIIFPKSLPEIVIGQNGKPYFLATDAPFFNISHSQDHLLLFICEQYSVGCDLEIIRERPNWKNLAEQHFSESCLEWLFKQTRPEICFWQLWTAHEAVLKQQAQSVWQMQNLKIDWPGLAPDGFFTHCVAIDKYQIALCGKQAFAHDFKIKIL